MAVYYRDCAVLLDNALRSVFENSLQPTNVLLVIDGSISDELQRVIKYYKESHDLRTLALPNNGGLACALNAGLKLIDTEWVVRADSDDINCLNRFEVLAKYMSPNIDLIGSQIIEFDSQGGKQFIRKVPLNSEQIKSFLKRRNPFNHMTVAYKTELVRSCGGYPDIFLKEDYGLWIKLIAMGAKVMNIDDILVKVNAGQGMFERRGGLKYAVAEIKLQRYLIRYKINNYAEGFIVGISRALVYLMPVYWRSLIYKKILRN